MGNAQANVRAAFHSESEGEGVLLGAGGIAQAQKDRISLVVTDCEMLMNLIHRYRTGSFKQAHNTAFEITIALDSLMKDQRFRWYLRGKKPPEMLLELLRAMHDQIQQCHNRLLDIMEALGLTEEQLQAAAAAEMADSPEITVVDDSDTATPASANGNPGNNSVMSPRSTQLYRKSVALTALHIDDQETEMNEMTTEQVLQRTQTAFSRLKEQAAATPQYDKNDLAAVRDDTESTLIYHLNTIKSFQQFILDLKAAQQMANDAAQAAPSQQDKNDDAGTPKTPRGGRGGQEDLALADTTLRLLKNDKEAKAFWTTNFGSRTFAVPKLQFMQALGEMSLKKKRSREVPELDILIDPTSDNIVTLADFKCFLDWFGPFKKCIDNAGALLSFPWFWGSLSLLQVEQLLAKQPVGTFIVRFHDMDLGSFCISCVQDDEVNEYDQFLTDRGYFDDILGGSGMDDTHGDSSTGADHYFASAAERYTTIRRRTKIYHFTLLRKEGQFLLAEGEPPQSNIQSLLEQYSLTFLRAYEDEAKKLELLQRLGVSVNNITDLDTAISSFKMVVASQKKSAFLHFRGRFVTATSPQSAQGTSTIQSARDRAVSKEQPGTKGAAQILMSRKERVATATGSDNRSGSVSKGESALPSNFKLADPLPAASIDTSVAASAVISPRSAMETDQSASSYQQDQVARPRVISRKSMRSPSALEDNPVAPLGSSGQKSRLENV